MVAVATAELFRLGPFDDPDRYEIGLPVEAGAEGILYRGRLVTPTTRLSLSVAVKALQPAYADRIDQWAARWRDQVELLRTLQIPGLVTVREGFIGPQPHREGEELPKGRNLYLIMNWVDGEPLDQWIATHPGRDPRGTLKLLLPVAVALDTMHAGQLTGGVPVVHRDVKPANILVSDAGAVLVDFGLTRGLAQGLAVGRAGTPGYIAPEVFAGGGFTPAADRYAFGATVFFLLTGRHPPVDAGETELRGQLEASHVAPAELVDLLLTVLDKDPKRRPLALANWVAQLRQSSLDADMALRLPPPAPIGLRAPLPLSQQARPAHPNGHAHARPPRRIPAHRRRQVATRRHRVIGLFMIAALALAGGDAALATTPRGPRVGSSTVASNPGVFLPRADGGTVQAGGPPPASQGGLASETSGPLLKPGQPAGQPVRSVPSTTVMPAVSACVDSYDPVCGAFHWSPQPNNKSLSVTVSYSPGQPMVNQQITFAVTVDDPDAANLQVVGEFFGDSSVGLGMAGVSPMAGLSPAIAASPHGVANAGAVGGGLPGDGTAGAANDQGALTASCPPHGAWTPPPPGAGSHVEYQFTHTYTVAGNFQVHFAAKSGSPIGPCALQDPYASVGESPALSVAVAAEPVTTPTTKPHGGGTTTTTPATNAP